jgi:hypothetical protein
MLLKSPFLKLNNFLRNVAGSVLLVVALVHCGSGSTSVEGPPNTIIDGTIVDTAGQPLSGAALFVYETNEGSITDDQGAFTLESYKHLGSASVYFEAETFTNRIELGDFPEGTVTVKPKFVIDKATSLIRLVSIEFSAEGAPTPEPTPGGPDPTPGNGATPTPKPSLYDANGNTTAFGIPKGMSGNISAGRVVWNGQCKSCHAVEKLNRVYGQIKASLRIIPTMIGLPVSNQQVADCVAYLNRNKK